MQEKESYKYQLFNVRLDEGQYSIVKNWWLERKWDVPVPESLPTTGVMIYYQDQPICAAWLYQTDSLVAMIGFVIADSKTKGKVKKNSIKLLFMKLEEVAKGLGFKLIFLPVATDSVARLSIKELNYVDSGSKINELSKKII